MSRNFKIRNQEQLYFVSFAVENWVDVFVRPSYKQLIFSDLVYCQKEKGLEIYAWCFMSSHIHLIIGIQGKENIQDILRDFKKYTSKRLIEEIQTMSWKVEERGCSGCLNERE